MDRCQKVIITKSDMWDRILKRNFRRSSQLFNAEIEESDQSDEDSPELPSHRVLKSTSARPLQLLNLESPRDSSDEESKEIDYQSPQRSLKRQSTVKAFLERRETFRQSLRRIPQTQPPVRIDGTGNGWDAFRSQVTQLVNTEEDLLMSQLQKSVVWEMYKKKPELENEVVVEVYKGLPNASIVWYMQKNLYTKKNIKYNGGFYTGTMYKNKQCGIGTFIKKDGSIYEGSFNKSQKHGHGRLIDKDGNVWSSIWFNDVQGGYSEFRGINGLIYNGEMEDLLENGQGDMIAQKYVYSGNFRDGRKHGIGKVAYYDGGHYQGNFKNNFRHGKGIFIWANGDKYKGNWYDNKMTGQGRFFWHRGENFSGRFRDDKRHGEGMLTDKDNLQHLGKWIHGKKDGQFRVIWAGNEQNCTLVRTEHWQEGELISSEQVNEITEESFANMSETEEYVEKSEIPLFSSRYGSSIKQLQELTNLQNLQNRPQHRQNSPPISNAQDSISTSHESTNTHLKRLKQQFKSLLNPILLAKVEEQSQTTFLNLKVEHKKWRKLNGDTFYLGHLDELSRQQGHGILVTKDYMLEGEWNSDVVTGKGRLVDINGLVYVGFFVNSNFDGHGISTHEDGTHYSGQWQSGEYNGEGKLDTPNGDQYIGNFSTGKKDGKFTILRNDTGEETQAYFEQDELIFSKVKTEVTNLETSATEPEPRNCIRSISKTFPSSVMDIQEWPTAAQSSPGTPTQQFRSQQNTYRSRWNERANRRPPVHPRQNFSTTDEHGSIVQPCSAGFMS